MSYQVLARKWRPQTFSDVVGQKHILTILTNSLSYGRIHHAYLFSGTRGVGKTTIARLLAKGLNCIIGITPTPCRQCDNCCEIEQGRFIDLIEIDAASRTKVEDTRDLLDSVPYLPALGRFKVYLIDEVHMLSRYSFNALLKTLEEPPAHVVFLLATTDPQKLPVTILSRCLQFHLKALDTEQICDQLSRILQQEHIAAAPYALQLLARAADGSMRDALSLADQSISMGKGQGAISVESVKLMLGTLNTKQPLALIESLVDADGGAMMEQLEQCAAHGVDWETLLLEMLSLLHRLAMEQLLPNQFHDEEYHGIVPRLQKLARRLHPTDLQLYYQTLLIGRKELAFAPNYRMGVEMTLLRALAFHPTIVKSSVIQSNTEKKMPEFSDSDCQRGLTSSILSNSKISTISCLTSRDDINALSSSLRVADQEKDQIYPPLEISERGRMVPNHHQEQGCFSKYDHLKSVCKNDRSSSSMCYTHVDYVNELTIHECNSSSGVSETALPPTGDEQIPYLLDVIDTDVPIITKQDTTISKANKGLIKTCIARGFNNNDKVQTEYRSGAVILKSDEQPMSPLSDNSSLPIATAQLLQARTLLLKHKEKQKAKKDNPVQTCQKSAISILEHLTTIDKHTLQCQPPTGQEGSIKAYIQEAYYWSASQQTEDELSPVNILKGPYARIEHKKISELALSVIKEALKRDPWTAQVYRLDIPKSVQDLALNSWKEDLSQKEICLHLRVAKYYLNSVIAKNILRDALSANLGKPVKLTITEDGNLEMKTPLEWFQVIYDEKLIHAKQVILNDSNIQILRCFFDAELDEDSIRPL